MAQRRAPRARSRRCTAAVLSAFGLTLASACAADPGPPPLIEPEERTAAPESTSNEETTTSAEEQPSGRRQVQVALDPVRAGFNPHLAGDESAVVQGIADLVLPSAVRADGTTDPTLFEGVSQLALSPAAFTVRYVIKPEAQWSDGTPITGADFTYLWRGMTTTAGAIEPAGYRAIADIRVSGQGGKVVDVDFAQPFPQWRLLFRHLLPSHLLAPDAGDFAYALRNTVPASAGRYQVRSVDRPHGTVTLHRNDRYWGDDPATIDVITLVTARETTQIADQLRSRQLAFADLAPQDSTTDVLGLVPGLETRTYTGPRTLGATISATSGLDAEARSEVRSLIDVPALAHIAARRSADLDVATPAPTSTPATTAATGAPELATLRALAVKGKTLRIAADAADPAASAAAKSLVDMLNRSGVAARVLSNDVPAIAGRGLPDGDVDVLVGWRLESGTAASLAGRIACPPDAVRAGNLSGYCTAANDALASSILAGDIPQAQAQALVDDVEQQQALWVPVLHETRVAASTGVVTAAGAPPGAWPGGLSSAATWRMGDTVGRRTPISEEDL